MIKREYKQINFGKSDVGVACRGGNLFTMIENLTIVFRLKLTLLVSCIVHREPHIRLSYILDCLTLFIENHILDWPEQMITSPKMTPARLTFDEGHIHDGLKNPGGLYSVHSAPHVWCVEWWITIGDNDSCNNADLLLPLLPEANNCDVTGGGCRLWW